MNDPVLALLIQLFCSLHINHISSVSKLSKCGFILTGISKLNEIRAKYKMELIIWDTTPPQAGSGAKGRVYKEYLSDRKELK